MKKLKTQNLKLQTKTGFTLLEMLIAVSLFALFITIVSATFMLIVSNQRRLNSQRIALQEARYALETIVREARLAQGDPDNPNNPPFSDPNGTSNLQINVSNNATKTITRDTSLGYGRILMNGQPLTSDQVNITSLSFERRGDPYNPSSPSQYLLKIKITAQSRHVQFPEQTQVTLQTAVSSRKYSY